MNGLDIVLIILLAWGAYSGFKKGFITELVASLLLLFGFIKGIAIFYELLPIVENNLPILVICFPIFLAILMFLIGSVLIYLLTKVIKSILSITLLGIFDYVLGALLGLCKSALLISLFIYFWSCSTLPPLPAAYIDGSELFSLLEPIVPKILQSISKESVH
jgi:membrane protein required for colicin V production